MPNRWLLDFDSTFNTLDESLIDAINARFGTAYTVDMIDDWDWWNTLPAEQHDFAWGEDNFLSRDFTVALKSQPHAVSVVRSLMRYGDKFTIVTDRMPHMGEWVEAWLERQGLRDIDVIVSNRKTRPKWQVAEELGLTIAVEDAAHNTVDLVKNRIGTPQLVYLMDRAYNRHVPDFGGAVVRVNDWLDLMWHQANWRDFEPVEQEESLVA